ncbi:VapE domain-containing protein [Paraprevotella clara]|uniref:VapE domain-containing protein n=1 Tax=Paraprevotella clara TaxID=454154 RepID=UPI00266CFB66|nr:VapE domain-containing protein [Paraprevotella clara]
MDFKKIAHAAVCRWNEKRRTDKTSDTHRTSLPEAAPAVREAVSPKAANLDSALGGFLAECYEFRFNVLTEATEFRSKSDKENGTFRPATERDLNAICLEAHRHGIDCWDRDVARMVHSADVREYHPFRLYFQRLPAWDGRDRLHDLAARVSDSPLWVQAFHRWMLGLAEQWAGLSDGLHAHSTAPLLVSDEQGLGKSTFCRALLPPELQAYYTDSVDLARPDKVERQLTEMGLLNLDEFDRIPEKKHPLLKNLMQLSALNLRKAYRRHSQALPRIASFIGTSNSRELLSDPSGSRRFICVLVEHPIDCTGIDHAQIYAQLKTELENGERYWFNHGEENALRLHNAAFYRICPAGEVLRRYYRAAQPGEKVRLLSLPEIFARLRRLEPGAMAGITLPKLAQALVAAGVQKVHTHYGNRYRVAER